MEVKSFFKVKRIIDPEYTGWIREQKCCLTGDYPPSINHHEPEKGHGGMGIKAGDDRQVPVRWDLHCKMEDVGSSRAAVWKKYGKDPEKVIKQLHEKYFRETGRRPGESRLDKSKQQA